MIKWLLEKPFGLFDGLVRPNKALDNQGSTAQPDHSGRNDFGFTQRASWRLKVLGGGLEGMAHDITALSGRCWEVFWCRWGCFGDGSYLTKNVSAEGRASENRFPNHLKKSFIKT